MYSFLFFKVYTLTVISFFYFCCTSHLINEQHLVPWANTSLFIFWMEGTSVAYVETLYGRSWSSGGGLSCCFENYRLLLSIACWWEKNGCKNELWQNFEDKAQNVEDRVSCRRAVEEDKALLVVPQAVSVVEDIHLLYFLCIPGHNVDQ